MWIFDLVSACGCVLTLFGTGLYIYVKQDKVKHPPPTLEEKIEYYEALNNKLRKEMEG